MIFFLLQPEAILLGVARVYKCCSMQMAELCYDGSLVPFIGASGTLLLLGLQGGSHTAVARWSRSPPRPVHPWTRSIADKGGVVADMQPTALVLSAERAVSEVEPAMTISVGGLRRPPALSSE